MATPSFIEGQVIYLPANLKTSLPSTSKAYPVIAANPGFFGHPVLISRIHGNILEVHGLTSFGNKPISQTKDLNARQGYLLIEHPNRQGHDGLPVLETKGHKQLDKASYVQLDDAVLIEDHEAVPYRNPKTRYALTAASLQELHRHVAQRSWSRNRYYGKNISAVVSPTVSPAVSPVASPATSPASSPVSSPATSPATTPTRGVFSTPWRQQNPTGAAVKGPAPATRGFSPPMQSRAMTSNNWRRST